MPGPLENIRVLDMTHVLNGPYCTMLLGHLGAEIIKVEQGEGDRFRHSWMPLDAKKDGYEFLMVNTNKKGITLNLKSPKGKELCRRLVEISDVFVENFSLGVTERLGLDYETLKKINPRIVYGSTKGYGESGPNAHVRSNAATNMAVSGWQHAAWEASGQPGTKVLGIGDEAGGVSLALGIVAALYARERTGLGQKIEVSMQEALIGFMVGTLHTHFEGRKVGTPAKKAKDGYYAFHLPDITDEMWGKLCNVIGREELREDPRLSSREARRENSRLVEQVVNEWVLTKTRREIWEILSSFGLSSGPVLSMREVLDDPHLKSRKAWIPAQHPTAGEHTLLAPWIRMSETPTSIRSPAPLIGQHNKEVYCGLLGLGEAELDALVREGVV